MRKLLILSLAVMVGCSNAVIEPQKEVVDYGVRTVELQEVGPLQPRFGKFAVYIGPYFARQESQIGNLQAKTRLTNKLPVFRVNMSDEYSESIWLVKLEIEPKDSSRHVKHRLDGVAPDTDWVAPMKKRQISKGVWEFKPDAPLTRGEYALWRPRGLEDPREGHTLFPGRERLKKYHQYMGGVLFEFGIDD